MKGKLKILVIGLMVSALILNIITLSLSEVSAINQLYEYIQEDSMGIILESPIKEQNVKLVNIHTIRLVVEVGESFIINATVINELPIDIIFTGNFCGYSSLSAEFNKNVRVDQLSTVSRCTAMQDITLKPGQKISITGPDITVSYLALSSGKTNTKVTFSYWVQENQQLVTGNVSHPFEFYIYS
jgi:hypothetical protein